MKRKLLKALFKSLAIASALFVINPATIKADDFYHVKATAYCITNHLTASETQPRYGVVAGKREWLGKTMVAWLDDGDGIIKPDNFYGIFECEDVGGSDAIRAGYVIDVWIDGYENAKEFGCKKMIVQILESDG